MSWLDTFKHVLPKGRAWFLTKGKTLTAFFEGLAGLPSDIQDFLDLIWLDIYPSTTRQLDEWDQQFALPSSSSLTDAQRRERLSAQWSALGGQSPYYIQTTLQAAGFDVYVHEWWEPGSLPLLVARNPFDYLNDGAGDTLQAQDGRADMQDGDSEAQDGDTDGPIGYPIVNKIVAKEYRIFGDGVADMQDGDSEAQDGGSILVAFRKQYLIPADETKYPYFLYIGGETFPEPAYIEASRRDEFEALCLKICPTEQWLGIIVIYS